MSRRRRRRRLVAVFERKQGKRKGPTNVVCIFGREEKQKEAKTKLKLFFF
jgi:hypothetical protein